MVKERPILFSGPMVKAILDGRKSVTRRVVKEPKWAANDMHLDQWGLLSALDGKLNADAWVKCPFADIAVKEPLSPDNVQMHYQPGMRLWVRESFYVDLLPWAEGGSLKEKPDEDVLFEALYYRADGDCCEQIPECECASVGKPRWRNARFMPRWASRITLEVTGVRVERLQDISEDDAKAEGASEWWNGLTFAEQANIYNGGHGTTAAFQMLWGTIHAADGQNGWSANPWVWVVEFRRAPQ